MEGKGERSEMIDEASDVVVEYNRQRSEVVDATDGETTPLNEFTGLCTNQKSFYKKHKMTHEMFKKYETIKYGLVHYR